jgi:hypothetical protein
MAHNFPPERRQMWIPAVTRIRALIRDLRHDPCWALAQDNDPVGEEYSLFHVMGDQKRGEARALP